MSATATATAPTGRKVQELESVTIRFAGDSGDGMQLAGTQFTNASAILGNDISTLPDFPAEIRAPAGTLAGVSGFQVHFASHDIHTPGDQLNTPRRHEPGRPEDQPQGPGDRRHPDRQHRRVRHQRPAQGRLQDQPARRRLAQGLPRHPRADQQAQPRGGRRSASCRPREADRCKNFFALGLVYWLYERPLDADAQVDSRTSSARSPTSSRPTRGTLKAGYNYGETTEAAAGPLPRRQGQDRAGHVPQDHRQRGAGAWAWSPPPQLAGHAAGLRQLPDHAGQRHPAPARRDEALRRPDAPGRGRDRRHRRGHRRVASAARSA